MVRVRVSVKVTVTVKVRVLFSIITMEGEHRYFSCTELSKV